MLYFTNSLGAAAGVLVSGFVQPRYGWRAVFFVGILPALFTLWVQGRVKEPAIWTASSRSFTAGRRRLLVCGSSGSGAGCPRLRFRGALT